MKTVNSKDNQTYKLCVKLQAKKYRDRLGRYLVEGINLIDEALKNQVPVHILAVSQSFCDTADFKRWMESPEASRWEVAVFDDKLFEKLTQTETSQGALAVVAQSKVSPEHFFATNKGSVVVLDRLQDPGNIGTIIRTADAAGYGGVIAVRGTGDVYGPKVVRAAAGSLFRVPVLFVQDGEQAADFLKAAGFRIVTTCFDTDRVYYDGALSGSVALIIGNEGGGVSQTLMDRSDCKVKIPMAGNIDSLNAAVAAGILMYESVRPIK